MLLKDTAAASFPHRGLFASQSLDECLDHHSDIGRPGTTELTVPRGRGSNSASHARHREFRGLVMPYWTFPLECSAPFGGDKDDAAQLRLHHARHVGARPVVPTSPLTSKSGSGLIGISKKPLARRSGKLLMRYPVRQCSGSAAHPAAVDHRHATPGPWLRARPWQSRRPRHPLCPASGRLPPPPPPVAASPLAIAWPIPEVSLSPRVLPRRPMLSFISINW